MSLAMASGQLSDARKTLLARWECMRRTWNDDVSQRFEDRFIVQLDRDLRDAAQAMATMDGRLRQIRRECE
ncbi:MAG: hypothetical protein AAGJ38_01790 [Planctomycetota bacterium]